uniref:Beta/gamma crystallin domain-containing protein 1 n=1 Tax=Steinernema glaseri TaxID=37863 RepID=A0A1I7ZR37_9BILA
MAKKEPGGTVGKRRFSGFFDIFRKKKKGVEPTPAPSVSTSVVEKRPSVRRTPSGDKFGTVSSKSGTVRIGRNGTLKSNKTCRAPPPPNRRPRLPSQSSESSSNTVTAPPKETNLDELPPATLESEYECPRGRPEAQEASPRQTEVEITVHRSVSSLGEKNEQEGVDTEKGVLLP